MTWMAVLIGILSSLCASALFLLFLFTLRPKLEISECIAKCEHDGKTVYLIKVINRTFFSRVYDITAQIVHIKFENVNGGQNIYSQPLKLLKGHIWSVNRIKGIEKDPNAEFAILFVCTDDLDQIWDNNSLIEFRVTGKHAFSGFTKIHKRRYFKKKAYIKEGHFKFGNSFQID